MNFQSYLISTQFLTLTLMILLIKNKIQIVLSMQTMTNNQPPSVHQSTIHHKHEIVCLKNHIYYIAYPNDQHFYIQCRNHIPITQKCTAGDYWNNELKACVQYDGEEVNKLSRKYRRNAATHGMRKMIKEISRTTEFLTTLEVSTETMEEPSSILEPTHKEETTDASITTSKPRTVKENTEEPSTTPELTSSTETTDEHSTIPELTTTDETTVETTEEPSTTAELTTTKETTEEPSTTAASIFSKEITMENTDETSATPELTTTDETMLETTEEPFTTAEVTTTKETTEEPSTTAEPTFPKQTTMKTTDETSAAPEFTTTVETTVETTEEPSATADLTTTKETTEELSTTAEPTLPKETTTKTTYENSTTTELTTAEETTLKTTKQPSTTAELTATKQTTVEPFTTAEPTFPKQTTIEITNETSAAPELTTDETTTAELTTTKETTEEPSTKAEPTFSKEIAMEATDETSATPEIIPSEKNTVGTTKEPTTTPELTTSQKTAMEVTEDHSTTPELTTTEETIVETTKELSTPRELTTTENTTGEMTEESFSTSETSAYDESAKEPTMTAECTTGGETTVEVSARTEKSTAEATGDYFTTSKPETINASIPDSTRKSLTEKRIPSCVTNEEFHLDPEDCHNFIQCSNGMAYKFTCGATLFWDQELKTCVWDSGHCSRQHEFSASKTSNTDEDSNEMDDSKVYSTICDDGEIDHPDPHGCHYFFKCSHGMAHRMKCPHPLFWNDKLKSCVWDNNHCFEQISKKANPTIITTITPIKPDKNKVIPLGIANVEESDIDYSVCQDGDTEHPDPYDCRYFIQCNYGNPYRFKCFGQLYWNQKRKSCVRDNKHCASQIFQSRRTATATTTTLSPWLGEDSVNAIDSNNDVLEFSDVNQVEPSVCNDGEIDHADPYDCQYLIQCFYAQPYRFKCTEGRFWNQQLKSCVWDSSHCAKQNLPSTIPISTYGTPDESTFIDTNYWQQTQVPDDYLNENDLNKGYPYEGDNFGDYAVVDTNICNNGEIQHSDPYDCQYFIQCNYSQAVRIKCFQPLYWHDKLKSCVWDNSHCNEQLTQANSMLTIPPQDNTNPLKSVYLDVNDSGFKERSHQPEVIDSSICNDGQVDHPDPFDCRYVIHCSFGRPERLKCYEPQFWNNELKMCIWDDSHCSQQLLLATTAIPQFGNFNTYELTSSQTNDQNALTCQKGAAYLPDTTNCHNFYQCSHGIPYKFNCGNLLYWDSYMNTCTWTSDNCYTAELTGRNSQKLLIETACSEGGDYLSIPDDCNQFIQCFYGYELIKKCPPYLQWDQQLKTCTYFSTTCSSNVNNKAYSLYQNYY